MIKPLSVEAISLKYKVDQEGYIRLSMNALLIEKDDRKVLVDPGTAEFMPPKLRREYGLEIPIALEDVLFDSGLSPEQITDVVFTHLHFDHASGGFKRVPGNILKRFPNARYHVLKEHYEYAKDPDPFEKDAFCTGLLRYLDQIYWLEEWDIEWISFKKYYGHTRGMVVPVIQEMGETTYFASDLVPMEIFMDQWTWCGYDLDETLVHKEKLEFLLELTPRSSLILFHDPLKDSVFYI